MIARTYLLELTAEELERLTINAQRATHDKLDALKEQAKADREADELRLPWSAKRWAGDGWVVLCSATVEERLTERAAKLMSAAPELLEAVKALRDATEGIRTTSSTASFSFYDRELRPLIDRALRKVETGIPEEP